MDYNFTEIEPRWQKYWKEHKTYHVENVSDKPHYYVLDMFPYPSGAGLHVGHPLGYIASDIYARYKCLQGFNVLHPMGYDAYGLPAEQYAIQTGQHPAITTERNIARYREQLDKIGFSFDWDREVRTCDPHYYKWTQWTFLQLFGSYYCNQTQQARPISELVEVFAIQGTKGLNLAQSEPLSFTAEEWNAMNPAKQQQTLMNYRLAYLADIPVNWCPELGTVLANDEVVNGFSVRGGYPVERKLMRQWSLRITAYAQRLVDGLETVDWTESLKEIQRNWIGRSLGASVVFPLTAKVCHNNKDLPEGLEIFTTRADTIFGVTFMVLAPEHELIESIVTPDRRNEVMQYVAWAKNRSDRERQSEVKKVSGVFTGAYAINPLTKQEIPIWVSDYVLMGYGTGAIMAVPAHDSRDFAFAKHFHLPVKQVVVPEGEDPNNLTDPDTWTESKDSKAGISVNSDFLTGKNVKDSIKTMIDKLEELGIGHQKMNFRLRDAIFSRQRYWGEPFPIFYKSVKDDDGNDIPMPCPLPEECLPLQLPEVKAYKPTVTGESPLGHAEKWAWDIRSRQVVDKSLVDNENVFPLELSTMPGFAGSSGYYMRYMDPHNDECYFSQQAVNYWQNVDLYVGGAEHGTGHLIYARFWNKFLFDLGLCVKEEPFHKLINQGMIQGRSNFVYRHKKDNNLFISRGLIGDGKAYTMDDVTPIHVDINIVSNDVLDIDKFRQWRPEFQRARFEMEDGKCVCGWEIEKMSKSMYNVQNPDDLVERYGADTLRLYEMFLGPVEQAKPWDTNGIEGVSRFMKKLWKLYWGDDSGTGSFCVSDDKATKTELKLLHQTIRKITDDIERFSFNTSVSTFMIAVNELASLKCNKREILEPLVILIAPFAPHIAEELWHFMGHDDSVTTAQWPKFDPAMLVEDEFNYPVSFNGKTRFTMPLPMDISQGDAVLRVLATDDAKRWLGGKEPKKVVFVPKRIINIVC